jgi:hypothetical protein
MDPKAPRPPLSPEELIALRDGELSSSEIGDALVGDFAAQRQLLESRLLSLALSLAGGAKQPRASQASLLEDAGVERTAFDTDRLVRYISGVMEQDEALAFERMLRGNPRAFAKLIEVKDAFFGQARALAKVEPRPTPLVDRETIGTLSVRIVGSDTRLTLSRKGVEVRALRSLRPAPQSRLDLERQRQDEEFEELVIAVSALQDEISRLTKELRALMMQSRGRSDSDIRFVIAQVTAQLTERSETLRDLTRRLNRAAVLTRKPPPKELLLMDIGEPLGSDVASLVTVGVRFEFVTGHRGPGELAATVRPVNEENHPLELTWVVPGVTFEALQSGPQRHELGRVRDGSLLLIDRGYRATHVLKVEVLEDDEDFF